MMLKNKAFLYKEQAKEFHHHHHLITAQEQVFQALFFTNLYPLYRNGKIMKQA